MELGSRTSFFALDPLVVDGKDQAKSRLLAGVDHIQAVVFRQPARATEAGSPFVLVGVTGLEPVASAV